MQLAIPQAPRRVSLWKVPGAVGRLARVLAVGVGLMGALGAGAWAANRFVVEERGFLLRARQVEGTVAGLRLAPRGEEGEATLEVLYAVGPVRHTASGVRTLGRVAEGLRPGSSVRLLVDPAEPERPREEAHVRERARALGLVPWGLGLGGLVAVGLFAWELRRTVRAELQPLRLGMLVWLTPDGALPESRREVRLGATYWKQDVKHAVRARLRGGRAPVRNGEKLLAAVHSTLPGQARIIDEDLARSLGWVR